MAGVIEDALTALMYTMALVVFYLSFTLAQDGDYLLALVLTYTGVGWSMITAGK